jgi:transcriptional regulator with XRE-family HTH domain
MKYKSISINLVCCIINVKQIKIYKDSPGDIHSFYQTVDTRPIALQTLTFTVECRPLSNAPKIKKVRKKKNLSQTNLAKAADVSYAQIGRYETKKTQPPAEVIKKIANALDTTVDYLINGDTDEKAKSALKDTELLQQFKAVEQMNETDRTVIKRLIDAFITKAKIKQLSL